MAKEKEAIWVGLDVGKKDFYAAIDLCKAGKLPVEKLPSRSFKRTEVGVGALLKWLSEQAPGESIRIVMETTGCYSIRLEKWLRQQSPSTPVSIHNGRQISNFIKSLDLQHKTDKMDAQAIARFGTERTPEPVKTKSEHWEELQELERERNALVKARTALTNRTDSLEKPLTRKINGRAVAALSRQIDVLDKEIIRRVKTNKDMASEAKIMITAPGVSIISASGFLAELGSFKQYDPRELSVLSGLSPVIHSSGTSVNKSTISRRGSKRVRQLLYLDSMTSVEKIPFLNDLYNRLVAKGKTKMTARCACMRKLLLMLRSMVVHNTPYDENFPRNIPKRA